MSGQQHVALPGEQLGEMDVLSLLRYTDALGEAVLGHIRQKRYLKHVAFRPSDEFRVFSCQLLQDLEGACAVIEKRGMDVSKFFRHPALQVVLKANSLDIPDGVSTAPVAPPQPVRPGVSSADLEQAVKDAGAIPFAHPFGKGPCT